MTRRRCNRCGKSMLGPGACAFDPDNYGLHATVQGGYSSKALSDETTYTFHLCERCLVRLFAQFRRPVRISDYLFAGGEVRSRPGQAHARSRLSPRLQQRSGDLRHGSREVAQEHTRLAAFAKKIKKEKS